MRVIVIGAGIIGVCTAYYLRRAGMDVTVLERHSSVAQETSFGNAGMIAPGYVTPWAAPGMPRKIFAALFQSESPVVFRPRWSTAQWRWIRRWLKECDLERYRRNKSRMQRVAFYSRAQLHALRDEHQLDYEQTQGYLQLLRTEKDIALTAPARELLAENKVPHKLLSAEECRRVEPALHEGTPLAGGLHLPGDEAGNCPLFARQLKVVCEESGVVFRFGGAVRALEVAAGVLRAVQLEGGERLEADAVVVAGGVGSVALLDPLGIRVPIYPVKGYSATVHMLAPECGPRSALMDESYKVAMTRLGRRLRIAGTAELGDGALKLRESALGTLLKVARDWFPNAARYADASFWVGARPMVPDGPPLLGQTPVRGLYLNVGHGSTGWAMACGSGRIVADVVAGRTPEIDLEGLTLARYG